MCVCVGGGLTIQHVMLLFSAKYLISALDCDLGLKAQSFSNSVCQESDDQGSPKVRRAPIQKLGIPT